MIQPAAIDAIMRTLADPTRRAVFERVASSDEITVVELTRGSGVTQGAISQHLKSLKLAGLVAERPQGRNGDHYGQILQTRAGRRTNCIQGAETVEGRLHRRGRYQRRAGAVRRRGSCRTDRRRAELSQWTARCRHAAESTA